MNRCSIYTGIDTRMSSYPKSPSSMYPVFPMYKLRQHPISLPPPPKPQNSTDFATRVLFGYCPQARWGKNSFMELSMPMKTIEFEQNYNKQRQPNYHLRVLKHQLSVNAQVLHSCFLKNHSSSSHPNHNRDLLGQQRSQVVSLSSKHSMRWFRCRRFFSFLLC